MTAVRVFFFGGAFAYRALFNWIHPAMFIPALIGLPLFQIVFFVYLGRSNGQEPDSFFIVGNAVQSCAMASVYGAVMVIANDRLFGTLPFVVASPANRFALFFGRAAPLVVNGLLISVFGFLVSRVLFDYRPVSSALPELFFVLVIVVASCTAFGLVLGTAGLRAREPILVASLTYSLMLLLCGVNVPVDQLPAGLEAVGRILPLTHGIAAARELATGAELGDVAGSILAEVAIGIAYATVAFVLFRVVEARARRDGTLEAV
ncbi:MAG: ABC transporter permease [Gaiellaceae bacterium]